ncbi:AsmA family protein [Marinomonas hwangdonensis]|uniref:AsmA family protein n=1 Tax=Marinomonas hwangdonensis TaxID=1053647 RepID=A0A3M8PY20_9GAMM|nr:AsmA family protein [Marinomonas hwangdonensis]RNF48778.1 AsmA family protein [Marinomonas hwangdonensis]
MVWLKRLSFLVAGILALIIALLAYVMLFVNPNDFKDQLKNVAQQKANVTLRLDGDIRWSFFPWLGLELENIGVALGNDPEILQFDRAEFGLAILPLFERKIQVDRVNLVNLSARLNKDANGQGNWQLNLPSSASNDERTQSPVAQGSAQPAPESTTTDVTTANSAATFQLPDLQLDELRIENAQVQYRDEQTQQLINATINVQLNDVQWDKAWPMAMDIVLTQSDLEGKLPIQAKASLNANLSVFPERESASLEGLVLNAEVAGDSLPVSPISANLSAMTVDLDLPQENIIADGLALSVLGVNVDAKVQAYQVLSNPQFSAVLSVGEFNPRYLLTRLNLPLPDMSDETALTKARAEILFEGDMDMITAQPISVEMDDTKIEANAVLSLAPLRWDVSIAGANLNLDRYLPTPVDTPADATDNSTQTPGSGPNDAATANTEPASTEPTDATGLIPVELIRSLNGHIGLVFEDITVKQLKIDKIELDSTQLNGLITVSPLQASLYQGQVSAPARLDVRGRTPRFDIAPSIDGVQIQPLLVDFMDMNKIAGATYLNGELQASGNQIDRLMASLKGDLLVEIKNGALIGTNLTKTVCEGISAVRKETLNDKQFGPDTPFETLRFPAYIVDGDISTPGLKISSAGVQVTGNGVISLPNASLDYQANVAIAGSGIDQACRVNEKITQLAFPIVCKGQFSDDPAGLCRPDIKGFGKLFADLAKAELTVKLEEEKARLQEKADAEKARLKAELDAKIEAEKARVKADLEAKRKAEEERLKDKLQDKLKGLFQ